MNIHACTRSLKLPQFWGSGRLIWKDPWCYPYLQGTIPIAKTCQSHPEGGTPSEQEEFGKGT